MRPIPTALRRRAPRLAAVVLGLALGCADAPRGGEAPGAQAPCPRSLDLQGATAEPPPADTRGTPPGGRGEPDFVEVQVFYGTDRQRTSRCHPNELYGATPGALELGRLRVTVPRDHRLGAVETPSIWRLEFKADPSKHVVLVEIQPLAPDYFHAQLRDTLERSAQHEAFVFIHGYNVSFAEAARRTAQIAYDLQFDGAPIFYSWPSQGELLAYRRDRETARASAPALSRFLADVVADSQADHVHLIAHSMGNLVLAQALRTLTLARDGQEFPLFEQIVLAAPDVEAEAFQSELAPILATAGRRVTLYTSAGDRALQTARDVLDFRRAGDSEDGIVIHEGIETVDATLVDTSFVGHSYYQDSRSVMSDLYSLLRDGQPAAHRFGLVPVETSQGVYWRFAR